MKESLIERERESHGEEGEDTCPENLYHYNITIDIFYIFPVMTLSKKGRKYKITRSGIRSSEKSRENQSDRDREERERARGWETDRSGRERGESSRDKYTYIKREKQR